ncbi:hypothetical protein P152DRAFT_83546 [Eremomyces bilateralis CBS 781.70]|uniref:Uncharacterized protein n=1 Tax=Eremomyces bilateralis CBS 781.70 TaxID=1392243 RepID=A0A6G1FYR8_9PEZI|nr:uncharacterized protein P152DRAFT_83546 [Eremomyces bilateralis CBS 781.70]KAF1810816.1 hypothetical protein P152DRAFT_83546 [Eremomyces bilateralis CBS 781.70]
MRGPNATSAVIGSRSDPRGKRSCSGKQREESLQRLDPILQYGIQGKETTTLSRESRRINVWNGGMFRWGYVDASDVRGRSVGSLEGWPKMRPQDVRLTLSHTNTGYRLPATQLRGSMDNGLQGRRINDDSLSNSIVMRSRAASWGRLSVKNSIQILHNLNPRTSMSSQR